MLHRHHALLEGIQNNVYILPLKKMFCLHTELQFFIQHRYDNHVQRVDISVGTFPSGHFKHQQAEENEVTLT